MYLRLFLQGQLQFNKILLINPNNVCIEALVFIVTLVTSGIKIFALSFYNTSQNNYPKICNITANLNTDRDLFV